MWIELHQTLPRHPKLLRFANMLRIHPAQAAGHLTFLWLWTLDFAPSGDLSAFAPAELSAGACYPGDAEKFCQALKECRLVDSDGKVHDWAEYGGKLIAARERNAQKVRDWRAKNTTETGTKPVRAITEPLRNRYVTDESRGQERTVEESTSLLSGKPDDTARRTQKVELETKARICLHHLNEKAGRFFRETAPNLAAVCARLSEVGGDVEGIRKMIDRQVARWKGTEWDEYLRPSTLFAPRKFNEYFDNRDLPLPNANRSTGSRTNDTLAPGQQFLDTDGAAGRAAARAAVIAAEDAGRDASPPL
jgi:uncharacterized phage protein (TIGR02220 family)